jgi:large subunit ribosomal protein L24
VRLRNNDNVLVIKGRDRGKQGRIQQVVRKDGRVLVEGVNMVKRHSKPTANVRQGGIIQKEMPIRVSNLMLVCTHCNQPVRISFKVLADGTKARTCQRCEEVIE